MASSDAPRPSGLIANKGLELLTWGTPNGVKITVLLEELKAAYGKDYTVQGVNIMQNIQKEPWFTKLGPNGRIPVLVDHDKGGFAVQEGYAILSYLTRHYDPENKFHFTDPLDISRVEQWGTWIQSGLAPMQGQSNHFYRYAKERIPYPTQRYQGETERLYGVLDHHLASENRDFIVGPGKGKYSIADMTAWGWVNISSWSGVDLTKFPALYQWWERIFERPATQKGLEVPNGVSPASNKKYAERIKEDPEFAAKEKELKELLVKAQEQYGYKYASP